MTAGSVTGEEGQGRQEHEPGQGEGLAGLRVPLPWLRAQGPEVHPAQREEGACAGQADPRLPR
jgi:hypothetical protein